ncbi:MULTISPECIES: hypothetical protein [Halolamina]|uniref:Uncharacterized protein n=1 Tax=Halolamina pelagica TaxID=699431 RepID=A0A1I5TM14_9EURY|nr:MULTISPECIES: hypothetical protein [Halolamina]NHX37729.1 hypothetical protein [Halolamina sp. R1-12]SFP84028.1 hypothetical protein SAMN05216277_1109 [Halolamina pelagica]
MTDTRHRGWLRDLRDGLAYPLTSNRRLLLAGVATAVTYAVLVLSSFPQFAVQTLTRDPAQLAYAVSALTREVYLGTGWLGIALVAAYALLTGVAVTNAVAVARRARRGGASTLAGVLPGLLAAGCASCGAGVLGTLGFLGAMAALPFEGNLLRIGGILLLAYFVGRTGDPRTCSIDPTR